MQEIADDEDEVKQKEAELDELDKYRTMEEEKAQVRNWFMRKWFFPNF